MHTVVHEEFINRFGSNPDHLFFCPGRVNLIGEHIDYNGGRVMPAAISRGTWLAVSKNRDMELRFFSLDFPEHASLHLQSSYSKTGKEWFNYPLGIINHFLEDGLAVSGLDMLFHGNLPVGAGLSSSASIEVLTATALNELFHYKIDGPSIALLSKKVENEFIGVNCGIMDQFAVTMGKAGHAILLDCDTLEYSYLPVPLASHELVIINTNKQRKLVDSKYNERFSECGAALGLLKKELDIKSLCELDPPAFERYRHLINNPILEQRAFHVISENDRVNRSASLLATGNLKGFGKLMYASHASLRDHYEVSGMELDTIVSWCREFPGCIGARMTGAGFGGCAIALVERPVIEEFSSGLAASYEKAVGYAPSIFPSRIEDGVKMIRP
jgi:galactokinase